MRKNKSARTLRAAWLAAGLLLCLAPAGYAGSFLWQVRSETGSAYLLGSIHFAKASMYPLKPVIMRAFAKSAVLVVEADDKIAGECIGMMMSLGMYAPGETMQDHLTAARYAQIVEVSRSHDLDIRRFENFKPWYAAMMVAALEITKMGMLPEHGIDKHFLDLARGVKPIKELEGLEFQIRLCSEFSDQLQGLLLYHTLLDIETLREEMDALVAAWTQGDAAGLEALLTQALEEHPEVKPIYEQMFDRRNKTMARKIEGYLTGGKTHFVVVGAGHLVGKTGIVALLKARGYVCTQL